MTQQADPSLPLIDSSVTADTTTPGTGTPVAQPAGWPPATPEAHVAPSSPPVGFGPMPQGPMPQGPQAPLNTLAWVSVVVAFVVSPVAIVLGILARKQIARTGERGRGLATLGAVLGSVFTVIGIATTVLVLALATTFTASIQATAPAPAVDSAAPAPVPSVVSPPSPPGAPSGDDVTAGQAQLMAGFIQVGSAADTMSTDIQSHRGDLGAMQNDFSAYRDAIARFRTTATTVTLAPDVRQRVDADLVPAIDRTLADLDTMSTSQNQSRLSDAADRLQTDSQAMVTAATAAVGG